MGNMEKMIRRLQNGNDVRGAAIAAGKEERTLTPGIVSVIAQGFEKWLAEETGKNASDLRIGIGHDSRLTGEELKTGYCTGVSDNNRIVPLTGIPVVCLGAKGDGLHSKNEWVSLESVYQISEVYYRLVEDYFF